MRVVAKPSGVAGKALYPSNRAPLQGILAPLPIGAVRPEGWLRRQIELMARGMAGRLSEISGYCRFEGNAWASPRGEGAAWWEELPYWIRGLTAMAYVLPDEKLKVEASRWIEALYASQRPDGYFGPRRNLAADYSDARYLSHPSPDLWPNMLMSHVVRMHYEATGDRRAIRFLTNYFRWQSRLPLEQFLPGRWSHWRAAENLETILWLYGVTGEGWLLELARVNHDKTQDWVSGIPRWHGVGLAQGFREPAQFFRVSGDIRYLQAAERNYREIYSTYGQVPGGAFGADEIARPGFTGPRQGTETCTLVEMMHSAELLAQLTADPKWADRCENIAFNSLPAATTPDMKALHYLTAPNQVQLDAGSKSPFISNGGEQFSYNPFKYRCCVHNHSFGWPYFARYQWMAAPAGGLAAVLYAPGTVRAKVGNGTEVSIAETTQYPFGDQVELRVSLAAPTRFPLLLRIPGWCAAPRVAVNGKSFPLPSVARGWIEIERTWKQGDRVLLDLASPVQFTNWQSGGAVSVSRGALTFSLRIGERWKRHSGSDEWPAHEVFPTTPWNYGLPAGTALKPEAFQVVKRAPTDDPFRPDTAPLLLVTRAGRIPGWTQEDNGMVGELPAGAFVPEAAWEEVTLIPMGAARLRISSFPVLAGSAAKAVERRPLATASTCWQGHTPLALSDGIVPKSSSDRSIPLFSWWDHAGSLEWVEYRFPRARPVSSSEVYWADDSAGGDTPIQLHGDAEVPSPANLLPFWVTQGGGLRPPKNWRLLWWDGDGWREVQARTPYGLRKDRFNRVEFQRVTTDRMRLEVTLGPRHSAGILEWRVGE